VFLLNYTNILGASDGYKNRHAKKQCAIKLNFLCFLLMSKNKKKITHLKIAEGLEECQLGQISQLKIGVLKFLQ
jgi:hypothetical protein